MKKQAFENEPWQENYYRTGATNPPKGNGALVTVLLVAVILLGGLASVLGIMNVQLLGHIKNTEKADTLQPRFYAREQSKPMPAHETGGALGMTGETVSSFLQRYYQLPAGVYVNHVIYDGAAHRAGLVAGDVVLAFGDRRVASMEELTVALNAAKAGDRVELLIHRGGKQMRLALTVG
jgi:membrane-associated protease RseP (regulator of RpoE activity)